MTEHRPPKAVLFDLDGTLADTLEDLTASVNHVIALRGGEPLDCETVRGMVGNGAAALLRRAVGWEDPAAMADFRSHYAVHLLDHTRPYPGVIELLDELLRRGIALGVLSNKPDQAVQPMVRALFGERFAYVSGERTGIPRKPAPEPVRLALEALGTEDAVYVGDSETDVETAGAAGVEGVFVTWGFRSEAALRAAGARRLAGDAVALLAELTGA
ncbi:MAG: HAD-IA family hydrolase [Oscillospiraceae bacterium]|nr:HAD-IA family hydrolase [Oscillospiraceae bacterium]